jgi:hypothetical protein
VTIASRPSSEDGTAQTLRLIWVSEKAKYFCGKGWTAESKNKPTGKSVEQWMGICNTQSSSPAHAGDPVNTGVRD